MGPIIHPEAGDASGIDLLFHIVPYNNFVLFMGFPAHWLDPGYSVTAHYVVLTFTMHFAQVYTDPEIISIHVIHRA